MAINVGQGLETVSPVGIPNTPQVGNSAATNVVQGVEAAGSAYLKYKQTKVLGDLAGEAQGIVTEASGFQKAKDDLINQIGETDRPTFERISDQLTKLRNGEVQGILSPAAASMRLQTLAKQYINRYPRMAGSIREMLKTVSGDINPETAPDKITDPVLQSKYALMKEAQDRDRSPAEVLQLRKAEDDSKLAKAHLDTATDTGTGNVPQLMFNLIDSKSEEVFGNLTSGMISRIKSGQFNQENELTALRTAQTQGVVALNSELTKYELQNGIKVDHKQFEDRFNKPFETLIPLAKEADTVEKQRRLSAAYRTIMDNKDFDYFHNMIGPVAQVMINNPEAAFKFLGKQSEITTQITHGLLGSVETEAKYNPQTKYILDSLKGDGKAWSALMADTDKILGGETPRSTGSDAMDHLRASIVASVAADPGTPRDQAAQILGNYISAGQPPEAITANPRLLAVLKQSKLAQAAIENQAEQNLTDLVSSMPLGALKSIKFDWSNPTSAFGGTQKLPSSAYPSGTLGRSGGSPVGPHGDSSPTHFLQTNDNKIADKLNTYITVLMQYKNPSDVKEYIESTFQSLLKNRASSDTLTLAELNKLPISEFAPPNNPQTEPDKAKVP